MNVQETKQVRKPNPGKKFCRVCGEEIFEQAVKCKECDSYQDLRRFIPGSEVVLALVVTLVSLVAAVGPKIAELLNHRASTTIRVLGTQPVPASQPIILVSAVNTGGQPALVRTLALEFSAPDKQPGKLKPLPLARAVLRVLNPDACLLMPNRPVVLHATMDGLSLLPGGTKAEVDRMLDSGQLYLSASVEEGGYDPADGPQPRGQWCQASLLKPWIDEKLAGKTRSVSDANN
jgi:ribosomal protein L40E